MERKTQLSRFVYGDQTGSDSKTVSVSQGTLRQCPVAQAGDPVRAYVCVRARGRVMVSRRAVSRLSTEQGSAGAGRVFWALTTSLGLQSEQGKSKPVRLQLGSNLESLRTWIERSEVGESRTKMG